MLNKMIVKFSNLKKSYNFSGLVRLPISDTQHPTIFYRSLFVSFHCQSCENLLPSLTLKFLSRRRLSCSPVAYR